MLLASTHCSFGGDVIESLDSLTADQREGLRVVYSSLPAAAEFTVPEELLSSKGKDLVLFDANYKPFNTKMIGDGVEAGCTVIRGSEMFWWQGVKQFELWFERTAPYGVMRDLVLRECVK